MAADAYRDGVWGAVALACALGAGLAAAQDQAATAQAADVGLDEVVVTAQRREESVQDVPIAITAFTAEELEARNVTSALDVAQYVPNLVAHNNTGLGAANSYYIRGLGGTESLATADPPVGTYVDEIYVARQSANNLALFDVSRVEILRGPQGTLFGRNTTGGAINIVMSRPQDELGGFIEGGFGSWGRRSVRGSVDLPGSERFLTKLSAYWYEDDGYVKNITTGERLNGDEGKGGRLALSLAPSEPIRWDASLMYTENFSANVINFDCNPAGPQNCDGRFASTGLRVNNRGANQLAAASIPIANGKGNLPLGAETRFTLASSNLQFDLGPVVLNAITGYVRTEQDFLIDFFDGRAAPVISFGTDPTTGLPTRFNTGTNVVLFPPVRGFPTGGFVISSLAETKQWTQEIKATGAALEDRLSYVGGLFYFDEDSVTDFADTLTGATGAVTTFADRIVRNSTRAWAAYAQLDFRLTDAWKVTAGVRYTDEKKDFGFSDNRPVCQATPLPSTCIDTRNFASVDVDLNPATPNVAIPLDQQVKLWTPRFAVNYAPDDSLLFFASATRGFKSGSQAARATLIRQLLPVGPEKVWSYELGAKTEWLDRRLRVNATLFLQDNTDFQAGTAFVNPQTGVLTFVTRNLADLENRGLELEVEARPLEPLSVNLSIGLQDIEFKFNPDKPAVDQFGFLSPQVQQAECLAALAGQASPRASPGTATARAQGFCSGIITNTGALAEPVRAPKVTVTAGLSWAFPIAPLSAKLTPAVNVLYAGKSEVGTNNLSGYVNSAGVANFAGDGQFVLGSFSREHTTVNVNVGLRDDDDRWLVSASCDNCTNQSYPQSTLSNFSYLNPPRSWAVTARWRF
jgi:iron complex outermembrane receptor protein